MQEIIVILIIVGAVSYLGFQVFKKFRKKKDDDCGCGKCD